jgi:hypothetical protein
MTTEIKHQTSAYLNWAILICGIIILKEAVPLIF